MKIRSLASALVLLVLSSAQGSEQPCSPSALATDRAGICVYNVGGMPLFTAPHVVLDGEVRGKLLRQQPWLWVEASPGALIVGIDLGKTPQARQRVQTAKCVQAT